jgi:uncharacterized protein (TIGR02147 family)
MEVLSVDQDYRAILKEEFSRRCQRNRGYSLRAYARDLGLTSARLSEILNSRSGLSRSAALKIAQRLNYDAHDSEIFCDLVESQHARSEVHREVARQRLKRHGKSEYRRLDLETFKVIATWYCFAIPFVLELKDARSEPAWIARALGIREAEAGDALETLKRIGLLELREGELKPAQAFVAGPSGVPSECIRQMHRALLDRAQAALDEQAVDKRDFSAVLLAVDSARVDEAKAAIREFAESFDRRFGGGAAKDRVYCLSTQFFDLTHRMENG